MSYRTLELLFLRFETTGTISPLYLGVEGATTTSGILLATTKGINYMDSPMREDVFEVCKLRPFEKTLFVITDAAMAGGMSDRPLICAEGVVLGMSSPT